MIIRTVPEGGAEGEVAAVAAARVHLGRMLQSLAVEVDVPQRLNEPLRSALVDGL